jgi:hypothetical protein
LTKTSRLRLRATMDMFPLTFGRWFPSAAMVP